MGLSLAPRYAKKFVEWGWGAMDGRSNYNSTKSAIAPLAVKELGIRNYVHPVAYERDMLEAVAANLPSGGASVPRRSHRESNKFLQVTGEAGMWYNFRHRKLNRIMERQ